MKSLSLVLGALALAALSAPSSAQRAVGVQVGFAPLSGHVSAGLQLSFGAGPHRSYSRSARRASRPSYAPPRAPRKIWVPGRYELVERSVWVPGATRQELVPACYETRYDFCGRPYTVMVRAAYYRTVQDPGCWQQRSERVWVAAHWEQC
jgi:hypothetical protein